MLTEDQDIYNLEDVLNYHINKYRNTHVTRAELYQIAYLGYLEAKNNFDYKKKGRMTLSYVSKYIKGALYKEVTKGNTRNNLQVDIDVDTYNFNLEENTTDDFEIRDVVREDIELIKSTFHVLNDEEFDILTEYYLNPKIKNLRQLAKLKGVTKQRIHQIKTSAINKIKNHIKNNNLHDRLTIKEY